jgi:hypothetical protein
VPCEREGQFTLRRQHARIIRALGWTNDHVYAETPRLVNQEEHSVISGDALPEIGPPAETTSRL